jgi:hypothetical protein
MRTSRLATTCLALALLTACGPSDTGQDAAGASSPSGSRPTSPTPSAHHPGGRTRLEPAAAFLPPEAAAAAELPGWRVDQAYEPAAGPLLDPCGGDPFPRADDVAASGERALGSQREAGGSELVQEVFRYSSSEAAADALAAYAAAVERCPDRASPQSPEGYTERHSAVEQTEGGGVRQLLVRRQPCLPEGRCPAHFSSYLLAAQAGDGLTVAAYAIGEDGDPEADARALLVAVAERLAAAVR